MPTGRGYPTAGYSAAAQQYRSSTPLLDAIAEPTIRGVRNDLTFVTEIRTRSGVMQVAEPFLVPLDTKPYEPYRPSASSVTRASALKALARYAGRLNPVAQALLLGVDLGNYLFDNRQSYNLGVDGWSLGGDWTKIRTDATSLPDGAASWTEFVWWFNDDHGTNSGFYSRAAIASLNGTLNGTGPDSYIREWAIWVEPGPPWDTMDPTAFNFETGAIWQGTTTPAPAEGSLQPTWMGPDVTTFVPYKAIPHQGKWDFPESSRGNSVDSNMPKLPQEAFASEAGRTYWVEVSPDGRMDGGSHVPPTDTYSQPPAPGEKERKVTLGKGGAPGRIFGTITEIGDFVDCLFSAIPFKQRLKDGVTKRLPKNAQKLSSNPKFQDVGLVKKAQYIVAKYDTIDIAKAINCLVVNEIQDRAIGTANQMANNITKNPYWVSSRGTGMIAPKI